MKKSKKKILLVEGDHVVAELYKDIFGQKFVIEMAHDGKDALEKAKTAPDLILIDVQTPGLNGYELLKSFKKDKSTKHIPVVLLSNFSSSHAEDDKKLALLLGAEDYLVKTHNQPQEILEKISGYLTAE